MKRVTTVPSIRFLGERSAVARSAMCAVLLTLSLVSCSGNSHSSGGAEAQASGELTQSLRRHQINYSEGKERYFTFSYPQDWSLTRLGDGGGVLLQPSDEATKKSVFAILIFIPVNDTKLNSTRLSPDQLRDQAIKDLEQREFKFFNDRRVHVSGKETVTQTFRKLHGPLESMESAFAHLTTVTQPSGVFYMQFIAETMALDQLMNSVYQAMLASIRLVETQTPDRRDRPPSVRTERVGSQRLTASEAVFAGSLLTGKFSGVVYNSSFTNWRAQNARFFA